MTIVASELWLIPFSLIFLVLMGVLVVIIHIHHTLQRHVVPLKPYKDMHDEALQRRIQRALATTTEQRERLANLPLEAKRRERIADDLDRVTEIRKRTERGE
ncbi:MAG: hypothetical protein LC793_05130 [Thermomicrobia bacterium]|nr:hypothetical protein [Thermomicrobia bacterium]MCA1724697.1 hypothetical protein [Thermomicrobia bacterium]